MQARTGVSGRMVPGAALASTGEDHSPVVGGKKKKKGGKKHRKKVKPVTDVAVAEEVENEETGGDEPGFEIDDAGTEKTVVEYKTHHEEAKTTESATTHIHEIHKTQITITEKLDNSATEFPASEEVIDDASSDETAINELLEADQSTHWSVPEEKVIRTTPAEWEDTAVGDITTRTTASGEQNIIDLTEAKKQTILAWFTSNTAAHFRNISTAHRDKIVEHLAKLKYPELHDAEWTKTLRLYLWRAVVRANFFWLDPTTKTATGKPKPILRPAGVFENHFEAFVECASERLDRIGRDLPSPEYVKKVEDEVRSFLTKVEVMGKTRELQHLAFLLMCDEEQRKTALGLEGLQERVRRAFEGGDAELQLGEFEFMRVGVKPEKAAHPAHTVAVAQAIWEDALFELA